MFRDLLAVINSWLIGGSKVLQDVTGCDSGAQVKRSPPNPKKKHFRCDVTGQLVNGGREQGGL